MAGSRLIRIYGDSLSLPRPGDALWPEQTSGELLRAGLLAANPSSSVSVFNRSRGGATAEDLCQLYLQDVGYFGRDCDGLIVVQCGVVDCAPRPVPPKLRDGIARLPVLLRWPVAKALHFLRPLLLRAGLSWRSATPERFESTMREWLAALSKEKAPVYLVNITPALPSVESHSPGLGASIVQYNGILARCAAGAGVALIDAHTAIASQQARLQEFLTPADGYHLTASAHRLVADLILDRHGRR